METSARVVGIVLLLASGVAAQIAKNPGSTSSWGAPPSALTAVPAIAPASRQVVPLQSDVPLPAAIAIPMSAAKIHQPANPLTTTMTAAPINLAPGDLLEIGVFDSPELTTHTRVTSGGQISFPLLGNLRVGGLTPQETQNLIRAQLMKGDFVKNPQVAVFVAEYADQAVYVLGEVSKPGAYPLVGDHRLFEFISAAGGFSPRAGKTITITRHAGSDSPQVIRFSRQPNLAIDNVEIASGDTINVGQAGVVYIVGNVLHPGGFLLDGDQQLSVIQALALAEGAKPGTAMKSARIVRSTPQGRQNIAVDLNKVLASKSPDLFLQDQDILYIPSSAIRSGFNRGIDAAVQATVGAAIYRW
jgi:polysaccharide biosynthesis/export protein